MKAKLEQRLEELKTEYDSGQKILNDIENALKELQSRKKNLEETLLRISGAMELLEELLEKPKVAGEAAGVIGEEKENLDIKTTEEVEVPRVVRQPFEDAKKILEDAGLQVGQISEKPIFVSGVYFGDVLRQNPKPGEMVSSGKAVDLVLATKGRFKPNLNQNAGFGNFCNH